jgi:hypothetical protein
MTLNPHPIVLTAAARQRQEQFLAEAARDRLADRAAHTDRFPVLPRRSDLVAVMTFVLGTVLTLAVRVAGNAGR